MIEDESLYLGVFSRFYSVRVALTFLIWNAVTLRIHVRSEKNVLAIRRPEFAARLGRHVSQLVNSGHLPSSPVEIRNPNLRTAFLVRQEREPLPIRRPARTVSVLICNEFLLLTAICGHDPDVRRLRVRLQI